MDYSLDQTYGKFISDYRVRLGELEKSLEQILKDPGDSEIYTTLGHIVPDTEKLIKNWRKLLIEYSQYCQNKFIEYLGVLSLDQLLMDKTNSNIIINTYLIIEKQLINRGISFGKKYNNGCYILFIVAPPVHDNLQLYLVINREWHRPLITTGFSIAEFLFISRPLTVLQNIMTVAMAFYRNNHEDNSSSSSSEENEDSSSYSSSEEDNTYSSSSDISNSSNSSDSSDSSDEDDISNTNTAAISSWTSLPAMQLHNFAPSLKQIYGVDFC